MSRPALDMLLTAFAEMLLPIKQQIDRLNTGVDDVARERVMLPPTVSARP